MPDFANRPVYEQMNHITDEQRIAGIVENCWKCEVRKNPKFYPIDYTAFRLDRVAGWIEIKHRNFEFGGHPDFMVSLHKYIAALDYIRETDIPAFFVIEFKDQVYWHKARKPIVSGWGGRIDRGDSQDVEPMARIEWKDFKPLVRV